MASGVHLVLHVSDLDRAEAFWRAAAGAEPSGSTAPGTPIEQRDYVCSASPGLRLSLRSCWPRAVAGTGPGSLLEIGVDHADVAGAAGAVLAVPGVVQVHAPTADEPWLGVVDPQGYRVTLHPAG